MVACRAGAAGNGSRVAERNGRLVCGDVEKYSELKTSLLHYISRSSTMD